MLTPDQFYVNEAWIALRVNEAFLFVKDEPYDIYVLMDAASAYVLGHVLSRVVDEAPHEKDVENLKKQVIDEVLPYGLKKFPEEFLETSLKQQDCQSISIPGEPLKLGMFFLGTQEVENDAGFKYQAQTVEEAKYVVYSQKPDSYVVNLPKDNVVITKAVNTYEKYLEKVRNDIFQEYFKRTFDHKLSDTLTQKTIIELGLPA